MRSRGLLPLALAAAALAAFPAAGGGARRISPDPNPCTDPIQAAELLCPRISLSKPAHMYFDRRTRRGHVLLRAQSSINSVGAGPVEFRGTRTGRSTMSAVQHIYKRDGGYITVHTGAHLGFKSIPGQYRYWKFRHPLRFELWTIDANGDAKKRIRVGPKQYYCLRDLKRTHPRPMSPTRWHYSACNQSLRAKHVTLGTSVGWSDIYPSPYHEQWIDVTGLHGRFIYRMLSDPDNTIYTSDDPGPVYSQRTVRIR